MRRYDTRVRYRKSIPHPESLIPNHIRIPHRGVVGLPVSSTPSRCGSITSPSMGTPHPRWSFPSLSLAWRSDWLLLPRSPDSCRARCSVSRPSLQRAVIGRNSDQLDDGGGPWTRPAQPLPALCQRFGVNRYVRQAAIREHPV